MVPQVLHSGWGASRSRRSPKVNSRSATVEIWGTDRFAPAHTRHRTAGKELELAMSTTLP